MRSASRRTVLSAAALAAALALVHAPPALAGVVFIDAQTPTMEYVQDPRIDGSAAHDVRISLAGANVQLTDPSAVIGTAAPCTNAGDHTALCPAAQVHLLAIRLGPMPDALVNDTAIPSYVCGEDGNDTLTGGAGRDLLNGGEGRDTVNGRDGTDVLAVDEPLECPGGATADGEALDGGAGVDQIHGGPGADNIDGGAGDDLLRGYAGDDRMAGGPGRDDLAGFAGDDELDGGDDDDDLYGGAGDDRLSGGAGDDFLGLTAILDADGPAGSDATETLVETGDDVLDGGDGDDWLVAGPGETALNFEDPLAFERRGFLDRSLQSAALNGADVLRGGPGSDEVSYLNRALPVTVTADGIADDGSAGEGDRVEADVERVAGGAGPDVLVARPQGSLLLGDLGADRLVGDAGPDTLRGGVTDAGGDTLLGNGGDDDLAGGGGDDLEDGGPGADLVVGDDGDDRLAGAAGDDTLAGGTGNDRLEGGDGADCLHGFVPTTPQPGCRALAGTPATTGADGDDRLAGGPGADRLEGGPGEDLADYADAAGPVLVALAGVDPGAVAHERAWADRDTFAADMEGARGGPRADTLLGNASDNRLDGGPGNDYADGGAGADQLLGGPGRDVLMARDLSTDALRCGSGKDLAVTNRDDELVALRADVCERADHGQRSRRTRVIGSPGCPAHLRLPGVRRTFHLPTALAVPFGTRVLTEACGAAVRPAGRTRPARVQGGTFSVERGRLALRGGCRRSLSVRTGAGLRVDGRFARSRGANARWTVTDGCDRTRVTVRSGKVRVLGRGVVRAPHSRTVRR